MSSSEFEGQQRAMIFRPVTHRKLEDGCESCQMSAVYCSAVIDMERRRCCDSCQHP